MSEVIAALGLIALLVFQLFGGLLAVYLLAAFALCVGRAIGDLLRHRRGGNDC